MRAGGDDMLCALEESSQHTGPLALQRGVESA
jgi:hypothetical protein